MEFKLLEREMIVKYDITYEYGYDVPYYVEFP